jgi:hypothetical protein
LRQPRRRRKLRSFARRCKTHGGSYGSHNTSECRCCDKDGKPNGQYGSKSSDKHKPFKKKGGKKGLVYMTSMLKAIAKGQKKAAKNGRNRKKRDYNSSSDSNSKQEIWSGDTD